MLLKFTMDAIQLFFFVFLPQIYKKNWMLILLFWIKKKIDMRKLLCPQCKIAGLYVKNEKERLLVYVSDEGEVVPRNLKRIWKEFDLTIVYCLWVFAEWLSQKKKEEVGMKGKLKIIIGESH